MFSRWFRVYGWFRVDVGFCQGLLSGLFRVCLVLVWGFFRVAFGFLEGLFVVDCPFFRDFLGPPSGFQGSLTLCC